MALALYGSLNTLKASGSPAGGGRNKFQEENEFYWQNGE
jgi:hypothetical protein